MNVFFVTICVGVTLTFHSGLIIVVYDRSKPGNPGEVEVFPPLACRACGEGLVISGGPEAGRTCSGCNTLHNWWEDDETGYKFFIRVPA